jgi:hypothetical protein
VSCPIGTTSTGSRHISADLNCSLANQRTCADRLLDSSILIRWNSARHAVFVPADPPPVANPPDGIPGKEDERHGRGDSLSVEEGAI